MYACSQCNDVAVAERVDAMDESYTALWCGRVRFDSLPAILQPRDRRGFGAER